MTKNTLVVRLPAYVQTHRQADSTHSDFCCNSDLRLNHDQKGTLLRRTGGRTRLPYWQITRQTGVDNVFLGRYHSYHLIVLE
jgi:hypothetical protein